MPLEAGTLIGRYEIVGPLGAGGMGEVYRARDARIGRDVALKVLPDLFATDPERLVRFEREAQVLGSLNHQNIAAIYGVEQASGAASSPPVLVMELVEGPTLDERISQAPIPIDEALPIAAQIAEALEAAHELGIIHRDLKPANIKLRPDGTVKVLDFGLAKIAEPAGTSQVGMTAATYSPTFSLAASRAGMIVGTAAYMAPEQARGRVVDKRADVWAFGVVLYEMLTGAKAFSGEDVSDTLASVIKFDPDWNKLPADTPPSIRRLLKRCLAKDPKQRLRDCGSALLDIRDAQDVSAEWATAPSDAAGHSRRSWVALIAVAILAAAVTSAAWALFAGFSDAAPPPTRRFTITLPEGDTLPQSVGEVVAIAPDGRTILYRAVHGGTRQLFRRAIDQFEVTVAPGVGDATNFAFSRDGTWLIFESARTLKKMPVAGGPLQTLTTLTGGTRGSSWAPDGRLFFGMNSAGAGLMTIAETGGEPTLTFKPPENLRVVYPQVIDNGNSVLFTMTNSASDPGELHVLRLGTSETKKLLAEATAARLLPSGHLVFVRAASLWAVLFDVGRLETLGSPVPVLEGVRVEAGGAVQYDVSDDGTLVFVPGGGANSEQRRLQLFTADGRTEVVPVVPRAFTSARLSPDGTRVAVQVDAGEAADVWVVEVARGTSTRLTAESGYDGTPVWSSDGRSVAFASSRAGRWSLNRKSADNTGPIEQLAALPAKTNGVYVTDWTADGSVVVAVDGDIGIVQAAPRSEWKPLVGTEGVTETYPALSPDGRWLAYMSNETGTAEVYVQRFPDLSERQPASVGGGSLPAWSPDGHTLFYLRGGPPNEIMRVSVAATANNGVRIGAPAKFADFRFYFAQFAPRYYDVARDGRIVAIDRGTSEVSSLASRQINVVTNWFEELKRLVPVR